MTPRKPLPERIAYHRAELERLTGKMVSLRDRAKFNATNRMRQAAFRNRKRERAKQTQA